MQTFKNPHLQNYATEFLDITNKKSLGMCKLKVCLNGGTACSISEITVIDILTCSKFLKCTLLKIFFSKTTKQYSEIFYPSRYVY